MGDIYTHIAAQKMATVLTQIEIAAQVMPPVIVSEQFRDLITLLAEHRHHVPAEQRDYTVKVIAALEAARELALAMQALREATYA